MEVMFYFKDNPLFTRFKSVSKIRLFFLKIIHFQQNKHSLYMFIVSEKVVNGFINLF